MHISGTVFRRGESALASEIDSDKPELPGLALGAVVVRPSMS
jgi:hypothetical protein